MLSCSYYAIVLLGFQAKHEYANPGVVARKSPIDLVRWERRR